MPIEEFDHYTVRTADFDASWRFYSEVLGLRCEPRPAATRAGFVYFNDSDNWLVHLWEAMPEDLAAYSRQNRDDRTTGAMLHVAVNGHGLDELRSRLEQHAWPYRERTLEARSLRQIHLLDADGIEIEINFPLSEYTGAA